MTMPDSAVSNLVVAPEAPNQLMAVSAQPQPLAPVAFQVPQLSLLPTAHEYKVYLELADRFIETGFLPARIKKPAQALAIMLTGREIGIPPMMALRMIHVIDGKPGMSSELQLARFKRAGGRFRWVKTTKDVAIIELMAPGDSKPSTFEFTMEEARGAEVTGKDNWRKYPAAMLRARVASIAIRAVAPDISAGFYDADELGAVTNETGDVEWPETSAEVREAQRQDDDEGDRRERDFASSRSKASDTEDTDPILPIEPLLSEKIRLSNSRVELKHIFGFVWIAAKKDLTKKYASTIARALSYVPIKLPLESIEQLTAVRSWIVEDEKREKLFADMLPVIEERMEALIEMKNKTRGWQQGDPEGDRPKSPAPAEIVETADVVEPTTQKPLSEQELDDLFGDESLTGTGDT